MVARMRLHPPSAQLPTSGSQRIALHSMFRIACETNQLTVGDVVSEFGLPLFGEDPDRKRKLVKAVYLIDAGSVHSAKLIENVEVLFGLDRLADLTLQRLASLRGVSTLPACSYRQWCPACYTADVSVGLPPYDRLLWSIRYVHYCPVHDLPLSISCTSCGNVRASRLYGLDLSGFCRKCRAWLGQAVTFNVVPSDDLTLHKRWTAQCFMDLLDDLPEDGADVSGNIHHAISQLTEMHHGGVQAHFAKSIGRNKSVVSTWLSGKAAPGWDALCDISFVYQEPLKGVLSGNVSQIAAGQPRAMPLQALRREGRPRRSPTVREREQIERFLQEIIDGAHPSILSVLQATALLGIEPREMYRLARDATKVAAAVLAKRRDDVRAQAATAQEAKIEGALRQIALELAAADLPVTRRAVVKALGKRGISAGWYKHQEIHARARRLVTEAQEARLSQRSGK